MSQHILSLKEAVAALARKDVSPRDLVEMCLDRIERLDGKINSFVTLTAERARRSALKAEAAWNKGQATGKLHGIPIGIKDIIETAGVRTTGLSRIRENYIPQNDATVVRKLVEAGTIILGKLTTHEFAMGGPSFDLFSPPARNPWNPSYFTGGSSSGSGAAVAAGFAFGALGSDTGGSIRTPCSFCGVTGLKTTNGLVSRAGVFPLAFSLDTVGPMARTSEDCALLLEAIVGNDERDPTTVNVTTRDFTSTLEHGIQGLRIGKVAIQTGCEPDPAIQRGLHDAARRFESLGAVVEEVDIPSLYDFHAVLVIVILAEAFAAYGKDLRERWADFGASFRRRVMPGAFISSETYIQTNRLRQRLTRELMKAMASHDVLLMPATLTVAGLFEQVSDTGFFERPSYSGPANIASLPALTIRCGFSDNMPFGMQLVGRRFSEAALLRAGHTFELDTGITERQPMLN